MKLMLARSICAIDFCNIIVKIDQRDPSGLNLSTATPGGQYDRRVPTDANMLRGCLLTSILTKLAIPCV